MSAARTIHGTGRLPVARAVLVVLCCLVFAVGMLSPPVVAAQNYPAEIDEPLGLQAAGNQTVTGTSSLDAGTEITIRLRSADESPFLKQRQTTVEADGSFEATFDLSSTEPGTEYTAVVVGDDGQLSEPVEGQIREPGTEISTVGMETTTRVAAGETARINVSMPAGGNVELRIGDEEEVGYAVTVALYDHDEDGEVGLRFDTAAAGTADPTVTVTDGDGLEIVRPETSLDSPLDSGDYPLTLYEDSEAGDPVTVGQLTVTDEGGGGSAEGPGNEGGNEVGSSASYTDSWWYEAAPGIAGVIALVSGIVSLRLYRR